MKIVIHSPIRDDAVWQPLRERFPDDDLVLLSSDQQAVHEIPTAEAYFTATAGVQPEVIRAAGRLRWIQVMSAGVESLLAIPEIATRDILITNARVLLAPHVAETGIALLTGLTRGVQFAVRDQAARRWNTDHQYDELSGKRALIVGAGGVGRALARRLDAFEVEVHAVDLRPQDPDAHIRAIRPIEDLRALLPHTDILAVCCPLTAATRHLIDAAALDALPDGAYLLNISRGPVVSTEALVAGLTAGRLRGAGLDVVEGEPLPPEHPLWRFSNVIITPHVGGRSPQRQRRLLEFVGENLERYKTGRPLLNVVDRAAGF